jgi:hypothetical protein
MADLEIAAFLKKENIFTTLNTAAEKLFSDNNNNNNNNNHNHKNNNKWL